MKLSVRGEYALRALIVLGLNYLEGDSVVRIQKISNRQNIQKRFLDRSSRPQIRWRAGKQASHRWRLPAQEGPENITIVGVVRPIEGSLAPVSCVRERCSEQCACPSEDKCALCRVTKEVRDAIVKIPDDLTVALLCEQVKKKQGTPTQPLDSII
jgi:DNA-binding IscR family transcriptional regulator